MSCPLNLCWIVSALIYLGNPKHEQQQMVCSVPTEQKNKQSLKGASKAYELEITRFKMTISTLNNSFCIPYQCLSKIPQYNI